MVFKQYFQLYYECVMFENDVKMYGIQTLPILTGRGLQFENDVKMYGIQTYILVLCYYNKFENDVKMYGIQTLQSAEHDGKV